MLLTINFQKLLLKFVTLVVLLAGLLPTLPSQAEQRALLSAEQARALGIETTPLARQQAPEIQGLPAKVVIPSHQLQIVAAPVAGLIESMPVAVNQTVKPGQRLARLQSPALVEAQRGFLQALTQAQLAKDNLSRDEQLHQEGIIAQSRYLTSRSAHLEVTAVLAERRQALRLYGMSAAAIEQLRATRALSAAVDIPAPLDGVIIEQMATPGQRVEAASPLYKVAQLTPLWLEIQAPLARLGGLKAGATVTLPAHGATGKLLSIGRQVDPSNQTVLLRAEITQGAEQLRPGQFVEATASITPSDKVEWRVPLAAVTRQNNQPYVFVRTQQGFKAVPITLIAESAEGSSITGPLKGDEQVAVKGVAALKAHLMGSGAQ